MAYLQRSYGFWNWKVQGRMWLLLLGSLLPVSGTLILFEDALLECLEGSRVMGIIIFTYILIHVTFAPSNQSCHTTVYYTAYLRESYNLLRCIHHAHPELVKHLVWLPKICETWVSETGKQISFTCNCHGFMKFPPAFLGDCEIKYFTKQIT